MIFFDVTKTADAKHRSGLTRVSRRLQQELAAAATPVAWDPRQRTFAGLPATLHPHDWLLTAELFSEEERPGLDAWLAARRCRTAAIFHDAIPLKHPHITWPQSVARHPGYLKLLSRFDRVWAVSAASRDELLGFWRWQGVESNPAVGVLALGADGDGQPRVTTSRREGRAGLLCVGIIEPRKNQALMLAVAETLWKTGVSAPLHLVGRVNPHFGRPVLRRIQALRRMYPSGLYFHAAASDGQLAELHATVRATVCPTIAEGCGLPLLESLWRGVPCLCSDLPVLRENADGGGCVPIPVNDRAAWAEAVTRVLGDDAEWERLATEATTRALPTWSACAGTLAAVLG